jgi:hypothetical protein
MSVPFKELGGSPAERYTPGGFLARREFLVAWEDRDAFAAEILGEAADFGATPSLRYPGMTSVFATSVAFEPFDPDSPDPQVLTDLTEGLNSYSHSFAKATVLYRTLTLRDRPDGPDNERDTQLTYRMTHDVELVKISPRAWQWADNPSLTVPDDLELVKVVPVTDHLLTWRQVIRPPWDAMRTLQGKVNLGTFLGCPEATVLFRGATANKLFRSSFEAGISEFCWEIQYAFRERAIKFDGQVYGWNHAYRDDPPGWIELTHGTDRLYELADLAPLFLQDATT